MNTLFLKAKQLPFTDAKEMISEQAYNLDITAPAFRSWAALEQFIVETLEPAISAARAERREKRQAAKTQFANSLVQGQQFKLESGLLIEFVSVNDRMLVTAKVIDEESLTWCVGDEYPLGVSELMKATPINSLPFSQLTKSQEQKHKVTNFRVEGGTGTLNINLRYDDSCGNGHNTFSITGDLYRDHRHLSGGCLHDDIREFAPEFAHLIKWHCVSSDSPMHYISNTMYHASDRDHNGLRKGEYQQIKNGRTGLLCWKLCTLIGSEMVEVSNSISDLPTKVDSVEQPECKYENFFYAPWCRVGEGKEPNLEAARSCAVWPDATLEQLQSKEALQARLPSLMHEFKTAMEALGFTY